eukprot:COSAG04_NODE_8785_length_931_cov_45.381010_2_plen_53_part_01
MTSQHYGTLRYVHSAAILGTYVYVRSLLVAGPAAAAGSERPGHAQRAWSAGAG